MKQRRFLRNIAVFTLAVTVTGLFSACFKKEAGPPKEQAPDAVELVYYKLFDDEDVIRPLIEQYKGQHPNVQITYRKFDDPEEYLNLIVNELAEGEGPDVFSVPNYWMLRNVKKVSAMPPDMMTPQQFQDVFVSVAANDLILRDPNDGQVKVFGIPLDVDTLALYYNKSQYEDKIPSRGRPADTWEGLKEDVFQLTKKDNSFERFEVAGIAMGRSDNIARAIDILYLLMLQYDTNFYNDNISKAEFTKQRSITATGTSLNPSTEALKLYTSFALPSNKNYSWNSYLSDPKSAEKELDTFARGKVTMIFGYSYLYEQIAAKVKELQSKGVKTINVADIRVAAVPQVIDPKTSTEKRDAYANYFAETVGRNTKHPREAWDFLMFMSSKDNLDFYNQKTHRPTSRRDMIDDQKQDPIYGVFADQIGYAESIPIYDDMSYAEIFSRAIDSVLATVSAGDALKTAEDQINLLLPPGGLIPPAPKADTKQTQQTTQ